MSATPRVIKFEQWQLEAKSEEEYHELRKQHLAEEYEGVSHLKGREALFDVRDPDWVLEDMIQRQGLTILHGDPGSGKSLIAMDWAYSLAHQDMTGWLGKRRDQQYRPLYMFTEGMTGLQRRTIAWEREHGSFAPDIIYVTTPVQMFEEASNKQLSGLERLYVAEDCDLLIIDTLANTMRGNENQQEDANNYLRVIRHFQQWGPVVLVHHNQKQGDEYRGSSVFKGAADTMVGVKIEGRLIDLRITKQKDGDPRSGSMTLGLREHSWLLDERFERNSVALGVEESASPRNRSDKQKIMYDLVNSQPGEQMPAKVLASVMKFTDTSALRKAVAPMKTLEYFSTGRNKPAFVRVVRPMNPTEEGETE